MGERTWKALPLLGMSRLFGSHLLQRQNIKQSFDGRGARTSSRFSRSLQPTAAATYSFGGSQAPVFSFSSAQYAVNESTSLVVLTVLKLTPGSATVSFSLQSGSAVPYDSQTQTGDYLRSEERRV